LTQVAAHVAPLDSIRLSHYEQRLALYWLFTLTTAYRARNQLNC